MKMIVGEIPANWVGSLLTWAHYVFICHMSTLSSHYVFENFELKMVVVFIAVNLA